MASISTLFLAPKNFTHLTRC